tara:strand:- start:773 stop:1483 length:711 start_codon:yes stop_codon:yes gene_type:complete
MNIFEIIKEEATPDADVIAKFAGVSDSQRSYYIMKWAEEKGIDTDDAMLMAGYKRGSYMGAGAYTWNYNPPRNEGDIDEAPVSTGKQRLRKIGAKVAGAFGAANKSAELAGRVEIGDEANTLKVDFSRYLGNTGKKYNQVTGAFLAGFLRTKDYPTLHLQAFADDIMTKAEIDKAIMVSAQKAGQPTSGGRPMASAKAKAAPAVVPKASVPKVPATMSKQINALSAKQKQQLASML